MIYIHEPIPSPGATSSKQAARVFKSGRMFSHMIADTERELRSFAVSLGMKEAWIQNAGTYRAHYDITGKKLERALKHPDVKKLAFHEFVAILRTKREAA